MSRFDPKELKQMAGEAAFARGADYAALGAVTIVSAGAEWIAALVQGSDAYRVRLRGDGRDLGGDCTCPARERDGCCKHLVAVALVANATGEAMPDRRGAIRHHLVSLGPDALAAILLDLAEREWDDPFDTFDGASETYAELLGDAGLAAYRHLAETAYEKLPAIGRGGEDPKAADRRCLVAILDRFAARDGDVDRRIALRRTTLAHAHDHLHFARFCLEQGRPALAVQAAEEGVWLFEDRGATPLVEFLAERLAAAGRPADAMAALWRGFAKAPAFSLFRALSALGAPGVVDRALVQLRARQQALGKADRWHIAALVELELDILMAAARLPEAWETVRRQGVADRLLLRLAQSTEAALPAEAAAAYRAVIERCIGQTSRGGYEEACRLLARLARLEPAPAHRALVADLRVRHRPKRSLLPMLDRHLAAIPAS